MATEVVIPKLGFSMDEGKLVGWLVEDGKNVKEGDPLFELESDKSINEVEAPASGILKILKETGEVYQTGTVIARIE